MGDAEYKRFTDWWKQGNNMASWLDEAEKLLGMEEEPGSDIPTLKDQIEDNQEFMKEVEEYETKAELMFDQGEQLAVAEHLDKADIEDVLKRKNSLETRWNKTTQHLWERQNRLEAALLELLQAEPDKWEEVWGWAGDREYKFQTILNNWQRFRREQMAMLNWLEQKEKELESIGDVDLTNEFNVDKDLAKLKKIESELHEQAIQLESLHKAGEDISSNLDPQGKTAGQIQAQLKDFDNCWNDITKRVIQKRHKLENAEAKLKDFSLESNAVTNWIERTEKVVKQYQQANDPTEIKRLEQQLMVKRAEKNKYQTRVDRVNKLAQDLKGQLDHNSYQTIESELQPINKRWSKSTEQLDDLEETRDEYNQNHGSGCCFMNIIRRKLRLHSSS